MTDPYSAGNGDNTQWGNAQPHGSGQPADSTYPGPSQYGGSAGQWAPMQGYPAPANPYGPGYPPPPPNTYRNSSNGLGVAGFVCGLLGLILFWIPVVGIVLALVGIVLGGCGMASAKNNNSGSGLAVAGLVLGIIALIPAIILIAAVAGSPV